MKKKLKICIAALFFILLFTAFFLLMFHKEKPSQPPLQDPDALWPEQGKVIAVIDGREYRYDPVYLYRLTGAYFSEDPNAPRDIICDGGSVTFASLGFLYGKTQGEAAVCLELLYLDSGVTEPPTTMNIEAYTDERKSEMSYIKANTKAENAELLARHEESKFYALQTDDDFFSKDFSELLPYTEKLVSIDKMARFSYHYPSGNSFWDHEMSGLEEDEFYALKATEEGRNTLKTLIGRNLMTKHMVEMVE